MPANRKIYSYVERGGSAPVLTFISRLDCKTQKKVWAQLIQLKDPLFHFQSPIIKAFRQSRDKGLYELRIRIRQSVRVIFTLDADGSIVLLHGFIKNSDRATERALEIARARRLALASALQLQML